MKETFTPYRPVWIGERAHKLLKALAGIEGSTLQEEADRLLSQSLEQMLPREVKERVLEPDE